MTGLHNEAREAWWAGPAWALRSPLTGRRVLKRRFPL